MNIINASKNHIFLIKIELINIVVVLSCKNLAKEFGRSAQRFLAHCN